MMNYIDANVMTNTAAEVGIESQPTISTAESHIRKVHKNYKFVMKMRHKTKINQTLQKIMSN